MRFPNFLTYCIMACLLWPLSCEGRAFQMLSREGMTQAATVICNGTVISIEEINRINKFSYPEDKFFPPVAVIVFRARIKVLQVIKGQAPSEIEFRYQNLNTDPKIMEPIVYGPSEIHLQKMGRYRFYLRPVEPDGSYVTIFDGHLDDNFAVEVLNQAEPDDSPGLAREKAIRIAHDYALAKMPDAQLDWSELHANACRAGMSGDEGAAWNIVVFKSPSDHSGYAQIIVRMDGTIDLANSRLNHP